MIPKIIHYCWFGGNPKSEVIVRCIESWKKYCPDYEIIEWNEGNFDIYCNQYVRDAYADKKWAFVSDYARLWIVYNRGGVYLDTDVLLHTSLDDLIQYECWLASEDVSCVNTGMGFGAEKENNIIGTLMRAYENYTYPEGVNSSRDTRILEKIMPTWEKSDKTVYFSNNTIILGYRDYYKYASHLATLSWTDKKGKLEKEILQNWEKGPNRFKVFKWKVSCKIRSPKMIAFLDRHRGEKIEKVLTWMIYDLYDEGPVYYIKLFKRKLFKNGK